MTIKTGQKIPSVTLKIMGGAGLEGFDLAAHIAGKKVVIFAVPGAFTPTCDKEHLPGYIARADEIKASGVDEIICLAVNDPFVMAHWAETSGAAGKVTLVPDGNGALTKAMGLDIDLSAAGLGTRSKRYVMVVDNGVVESLEIEENPAAVSVSGAQSCAVKLAA